MTSRRRHVNVRRATAVTAGKLSAAASRALGKGGGTALPGLVAARLDPSLVRVLTSQLRCGAVIISGTNGKTTTARMLGTMLDAAGFTPLRNEAGSNLIRGLASSLVREANVLGNLPNEDRSLGIFEVDEAALPGVLREISPRGLLLLDLFRDQLDRYGEVATIGRLWSDALARVERGAIVAFNADDPLIAHVVLQSGCRAIAFGLEYEAGAQRQTDHGHDAKSCPACGGPIVYQTVSFAHLGSYRCLDCGFHRPEPSIRGRNVRLRQDGADFTLESDRQSRDVSIRLPGLHNVYNALAASTIALSLGVDVETIAGALAIVAPAFGRMESFDLDGRRVVIALAKNPAGLNVVLRTVTDASRNLYLLAMLNDKVADGRDVSWIWDADVEQIAGRVDHVVFGGTRAEDLALRFKYGGVIGDSNGASWSIEHDTEQAFAKAMQVTPAGQVLYAIPTYTALLDLHSVLSRRGHVRPFWEG